MEAMSPYNANELARARDVLSSEIEKDTYKFLHRRMNGFTRSRKEFSENMWEGPDGNMDHVVTGFPMPAYVEPESNQSVGSPKISTSVEDQQNEVTISPECPSDIVIVSSDNDSSLSDGEYEDEFTSLAQSTSCGVSKSSPSQPGIDISQDCVNNNVTSTNSSSNSHDTSPANNALQRHWAKLSSIQHEIKSTRKALNIVKSLFKQSKSQKACKEMEDLYLNTHSLITNLSEEKKCIEQNNFKPVLVQKQNGNMNYRSYQKTWSELKRLCSKFKFLWRANKMVILRLSSIEEAPQGKLLLRLQRINPTTKS